MIGAFQAERTARVKALGGIPEWDVEGQMDRVSGKWQCTVSCPLTRQQSNVTTCWHPDTRPGSDKIRW